MGAEPNIEGPCGIVVAQAIVFDAELAVEIAQKFDDVLMPYMRGEVVKLRDITAPQKRVAICEVRATGCSLDEAKLTAEMALYQNEVEHATDNRTTDSE